MSAVFFCRLLSGQAASNNLTQFRLAHRRAFFVSWQFKTGGREMQKVKAKKTTVRSKNGASPYGPQERAIRMMVSTVEENHRGWIKHQPKGSLETLLSHLTAAMEECEAFDDELILDHLDSVGAELGYELSHWAIEAEETFDYRLAELEEYVSEIEELIEVFGSAFIVSKLPKLTARQLIEAAKKLAA